MKFSDGIKRNSLDEVYVIRTEKDMNSREESNSNLWDIKRKNLLKKGNNLYQTVVRDVRIGENICNNAGRTIAYRAN